MSHFKYTFLLPAYKTQYLREALLSIKNQTYKNFKVIVSDDCSPQPVGEIYKGFDNDSRFEYRRNEQNIGGKSLVAHWELLVNMCDTEFFIMASDDDVYAPTFLEEIDRLVEAYENVDLFRARCKKINGNGDVVATDILYEEHMNQLDFVYASYNSDFIACEANYCYRTKPFKEKSGFVDFPSAWFTDYATCFAMAENGCCTTNEMLFHFRCSDANITSQWGNPEDSKKKVQACILFDKWMCEFTQRLKSQMENTLLNRSKLGRIQQRFKQRIAHHFQNHIYHCHWSDFWQLYHAMPTDLGLSKKRVLLHYLKSRIR